MTALPDRTRTVLRAAACCAAGLAALLAVSAPAPRGALAQTSAPLCDPTPTVSATADSNSVYTTTIVCGPRAGKGEDEADYRHIHWNQPGGGRWAVVRSVGSQHNEAARGTGTPTNNAAGNHVHLTVKSGVVFDADGQVDMRSFVVDGAVRLIAADATVVIEEGAVLNINRRPAAWHTSHLSRPSTPAEPQRSWYPGFADAVSHQGAIDVRGDDGDLTVRHNGVINFNVRNAGSWHSYGSNSSAIYVQNPDTTSDSTRRDHDILVELGATGVIRHVEGSDGGNAIYAEQTLEDGDVTINLAEGSLIDVTGEGGYGLYARAGFFGNSNTNTAADASNNKYVKGDVIVNAGGTIRAAVKQSRTVNVRQGTGITAVHASAGRVRVASSGTIEARQRAAIDARAFSSSENAHRDDASTPAIEGHLVDVTGGTVEARGHTAIYASTGGTTSAFTVRVADGATVRAQALTEADYDDGAITQEDFGEHGDAYFTSTNIHYYGYRSVELTRNVGGTPTTVKRIAPVLTAIVVRNFSSSSPASGVRDHAIVDGTVETVGASEYDAAIWMERGGAVTIGSTGVIKASSGLAIASGCDARITSAVNTKPLWQGLPNDSLTPYRLCYYQRSEALTVNVAGRVEGDIRALRGALTANVTDGGVVAGTLHDPQTPYTVADGASIGRLLWTGTDPITVTVNGGGTLTGVDGKAIESTNAAATATLAVTVNDEGRVEGDILAGAALTATVMDGGVVTGTIHDPQTPFTVVDGASIGKLRYTGDTAAAVTVADGGTLTGVEGMAVESTSADAAATLAVTVQDGGRVEGGIQAGAALTATVEEGGVVTGAIHNPQSPYTVARGVSIGKLRWTGDSAITVAVVGGGKLTGVEGKAIESTSTTAALSVVVNPAGRVEGDIEAGGALTATVQGSTAAGGGGVVTGTIHNPQTPYSVANGASIGRLLWTRDAPRQIKVTVLGGGKLTGVEGKAIESTSETAALEVTVQDEGRVEGDILAGGALTAVVMDGGVVTGTIHEPGAFTALDGARIGRLLYGAAGTVTVSGGARLTGVGGTGIESTAGPLTVAVQADGRVEGDIVSGGALTANIVAGGVVTGTLRGGAGPVTVGGRVGRVLIDDGGDGGGKVTVAGGGEITGVETGDDGAREAIRGDAGNLDVTVAANGEVTGLVEGRGAGDMKVSVAGSVTGDIAERGAGNLDLTVSGTVAGGVVGEGAGEDTYKVAVESAGSVTGTVRLPANAAMTVAGKVGRIRYDNGGAVTVNANGEIAGIDIEGVREAIRGDAGDLTVTVHGTVTGNIDGRGDGDLTVTVSESGTVTGEIFGRGGGTHTIAIAERATVLGTVHNPKSGTTISGRVGRVLFDNGGALTIAASGSVAGIGGEAIRSAAGDLTATVAGKATGRVESRGGALDATVTGTVEGDILGLGDGDHTVAVRGGGLVTGTVRLAASEVNVEHGAVARVLLDKGGDVTVGARGRISGLDNEGAKEAIRADAGDLTVAVASGGAVAGRIEGLGAGGMDVDVSGSVEGAIRGRGAGTHDIAVASGGAVTGDIVDMDEGNLTASVAGAVTGDILDMGAGNLTASVASGGAVTGDIVDMDAGNLTASVAGRLTGSIEERGAGDLRATVTGTVAGDIRGMGAGSHTVEVRNGGAVTGTVRLPSSQMMLAGRVGRVIYDNGGSISVAATGSVSGVELPGGVIEAIRSSAGNLAVAVAADATVTGDIRGEGDGNLNVDVSGTVEGRIFGLGAGEHDVHVRPGGAVEGLIHLEASTVTVEGSAARVLFDRGGTVAVGAGGELSGLGGSAVHSLNGDLTVTVNGDVVGSVVAGDGVMDSLTVQPDGFFQGVTDGIETVRIDGRAEGTLRLPPRNDVDIPGELKGGEDEQGRRVAIIVETGPLDLNVQGTVEGAVDAPDAAAASAVKVGNGGAIAGKVTLEGAGSEIEVDGVVQSVDAPRGAVTVGENGRIEEPVVGAVAVTVKAKPEESDEDAAQRVGGGRIEDPDARIVLQREGQPDRPLALTADGGIRIGPAPRHSVYEALPSAMLALNALPEFGGALASAGARGAAAPARYELAANGDMAIARGAGRGAWVRLHAGGGDRSPASTAAGSAHDLRRYAFEAGMEGAAGDNALVSVSVHHVRGEADTEGEYSGGAEVSGTGARLAGAWVPAGGYYVGAQAAATLYEADLTSADPQVEGGALASDLSGRGYAVDAEAGRRFDMGRMALTPRARVSWARIDMSSFTDALGDRVTLEGRSVKARAGFRVETAARAGGVFATVDVERELSGTMRATAADLVLDAEAEDTWLRLGLGGAHEWADGRFILRGDANYAAARNGNRDFGGSASLTVRF